MTKNTMALFSTVCFLSISFGCGSNDPEAQQSCQAGSDPSVSMNCYTPEPDTGSITTETQTTGGTTGTTTSTDTGSGSTTGTTTSTQTSVTTTSTTTSTATNGPVTLTLSDGRSCDPATDPREAAAGGILDLSGTWKVTTANGKEVVLKANTDTYGLTTACGIPTDVASPTPTHWNGVSTRKCIGWVPDNNGSLGSNAPWIQGTGVAPDATGTTCIIGGNPNLKICRILQTIPGCP